MYNKAAYATRSESIIDSVYADQRDIVFAGQTVSLCTGLEIGGSDDGVEFIIIDTESGDEYGIICTNMTKAQMQMCADAANEMYAEHVADLANDKASNQDYWL